MHPRVSVSAVSSWRWSLDEDLAFWAEADIDHVGLSLRKLEERGVGDAARRVRDAGLRVSTIGEVGWWALDDPSTWPAQQDRLRASLDAAAVTGASSVVLTSGSPGTLGWDAALDALATALDPVRVDAAGRGIVLALENTSPLRLDLSFVTTLGDTLDAARSLGVGVCVEVNSCFAERGLLATLRSGVDTLAHVQLNDFVIGTRCTPDRAVPGDGDIPLGEILRALLDAGYRGPFELEVVGPRIEAEGYASAIRRGVEYLSRLLAALTPSVPLRSPPGRWRGPGLRR